MVLVRRSVLLACLKVGVGALLRPLPRKKEKKIAKIQVIYRGVGFVCLQFHLYCPCCRQVATKVALATQEALTASGKPVASHGPEACGVP